MLVTLFGIIMLDKLSQSRNKLLAIEVIPFGMFIFDKFLHPEKAQAPMLVTLLGIMIFVRLSQL